MIRLFVIAVVISTCWRSSVVFGHGNPITVHVSNGRLKVSNGLQLSSGYAALAFDYHEDAYLDLAPGNTLGSTLPGFNVEDVATDSGLFLEIVSRPDFTNPATPQRWLWFWDKTTQQVAVAPNDPFVRVASQRGFGDVRITQYAPVTSSTSVRALEPRASDIGTHQHPFLYLLDNSPAAEYGAYGFFARLTSPNYGASEPFLIALNHTLSSEEYDAASRAINVAAALPGDYNRDDSVDGADFLAWQRSFGSTTDLAADGSLNKIVDADDLAIWKENFGRTWPAPASAVAIPEPAAVSLFAWGLLLTRRRCSA